MPRVSNVDGQADEFAIGVGVQLRALRIGRGLSMAQLLTRCELDISLVTLGGYETGRGNLHLRRLFVLAHGLGATPHLVLVQRTGPGGTNP